MAWLILIALPESLLAQSAQDATLTGDEPDITEERVDAGVPTLPSAVAPDQPVMPDGGVSYAPPGLQPRKPYELHFRFKVNATYDSNVFIQKDNPQSDVIIETAAGVTFGLGDVDQQKDSYLSLSYDITPYFFTQDSSLNTVNHEAALHAQWHGEKLTLGSMLRFIDFTGSDKDAGTRVNRKIYDGHLFGTYAFSDKTRVGMELESKLSDYVNQLDTTETSLATWADYQVTPLISAGLQLTLGDVDVEDSGHQTYEQIGLRAGYNLAAKVDMTMHVGLEFRQTDVSDARTTPVFSLALAYSPYDLLKLKLEGYRRVVPSVIDRNENNTVTGVSLGISERFLQRFEASLSGGYEHSDYQSESRTVSTSRSEDYFFGHVGLAYILSENWRLEAFAELRSNNSSEDTRSFKEHQAGLSLSFNF